jgi:hypothetical protein
MAQMRVYEGCTKGCTNGSYSFKLLIQLGLTAVYEQVYEDFVQVKMNNFRIVRTPVFVTGRGYFSRQQPAWVI